MTTEQRFAELTGHLKPILGDRVTPEVRELARLVQVSIRQDAAAIARYQRSHNAAVRAARYAKHEVANLERCVEGLTYELTGEKPA